MEINYIQEEKEINDLLGIRTRARSHNKKNKMFSSPYIQAYTTHISESNRDIYPEEPNRLNKTINMKWHAVEWEEKDNNHIQIHQYSICVWISCAMANQK